MVEEYGEEFELLKTDMSLRRRSEEVVKMQDRLQMSPMAVTFRDKLSGKEKQERKTFKETDTRVDDDERSTTKTDKDKHKEYRDKDIEHGICVSS